MKLKRSEENTHGRECTCRVLRPPSRLINRSSGTVLCPQVNKTGCACSCKRGIHERACARRGIHKKDNTKRRINTEGNTDGMEYTQSGQQKMVHDLTGLEDLLANLVIGPAGTVDAMVRKSE